MLILIVRIVGYRKARLRGFKLSCNKPLDFAVEYCTYQTYIAKEQALKTRVSTLAIFRSRIESLATRI